MKIGYVFGYDYHIREVLRESLDSAGWVRYNNELLWACKQPPVFLPARLTKEYRAQIHSLDVQRTSVGGVSEPPNISDGDDVYPDMAVNILEVEGLVGRIPLSLRVWYECVGAVNFFGFHPEWATYVPLPEEIIYIREQLLMSMCDPIQVYPLDDVCMAHLRTVHKRRGLVGFEFAPDRHFKDNRSGSSTPYEIDMTRPGIDGMLADSPAVTFVQYLRRCIQWGDSLIWPIGLARPRMT